MNRLPHFRTAANAALLSAALALPLSGCETIEGLSADSFNEMIGAAAAGAGCAAISSLTGGDSKQNLAAGAVCAIVGYGVTKEMENRREEFASDEQFYAAETRRLAAYEQELAGEIDSARRELAADKAAAAALAGKARRSEAEQRQLEVLASELETREEALGRQLATAEENRKYQQGLVIRMKETEGQASPQAERQLAALESSVDELRALVGEHEVQTASLGAYL